MPRQTQQSIYTWFYAWFYRLSDDGGLLRVGEKPV